MSFPGDEYGNRLIMLAGDKGNATVRFAPEEVPGMIEPGNIDLSARPVVRHADGSISTVRSISVEMDGKEYLIPTVSEDGKVLSEDDAVKQFKKTGKRLGVFDSPEDATAYARQLHEDQESLYAPQQGAADALEPARFLPAEGRPGSFPGSSSSTSPPSGGPGRSTAWTLIC